MKNKQPTPAKLADTRIADTTAREQQSRAAFEKYRQEALSQFFKPPPDQQQVTVNLADMLTAKQAEFDSPEYLDKIAELRRKAAESALKGTAITLDPPTDSRALAELLQLQQRRGTQ